MKHISNLSIINYLILIIILAFAVGLFIYFQGFPNKQLTVIELTGLSYFLWGVLFHYLESDLHPKIVVEYLLMAILAVLLLRGAIYK